MSADYKKDSQWLKTLRKEIKVEKQQELVITVEHVKFALAKTPNWKSSGPDLVQGYRLKKFSSLKEMHTS